MKKEIIILVVFVIVAAAGAYLISKNEPVESSGKSNVASMGVLSGYEGVEYKSPTCGCCSGYAGEAKELGMNVNVIKTEDMDAIKNKYNIPKEMESCHTLVVDDYFIEGHVPFEVVEKLLKEKPDIDGIALPDMPAGTPGMPGTKQGPYKIYQLIDGEYNIFIEI